MRKYYAHGGLYQQQQERNSNKQPEIKNELTPSVSHQKKYPDVKKENIWRDHFIWFTYVYTMYEEEGTEAEDSKPWNFQQNHSLGYGDEFELKK